jgi:spermidine synthase
MHSSFAAATYAGLAIILILANVYLSLLYRASRNGNLNRSFVWAPRSLDFAAEDLGGFSYWQLAVASAAGLFLELLLIRWISSEIQVFAYFKNFVLTACFLGFGLGCCLCKRRIRLLSQLLPWTILTLVVSLPWQTLRQLLFSMPTMIGGLAEVDVSGVPSLPHTGAEWMGILQTITIIVPLFGLIAFSFVPVGQIVGWSLENSKGIKGYTVNVLSSLAGIVLYTILCFLDQPPAVWIAVAGALLVALFWRLSSVRWVAGAAFAACVALTALAPHAGRVYWSPYQRLIIRPPYDHQNELVSYEVRTNDSWYQQIYDLSPEFTAKHPELFQDAPAKWNPYNMPYRFFPNPPSVLVLGAGTGNDVAAAVRNGAQRVVAVEIDPLIQQLGRDLHFEKPYSSPRVQVVVNDARSYLENSQEKFDVIMFSLLDSHTTTSYYTNIRIDNYVYTLEALTSAKKLLKPDGLMFLKFWVDTPWIANRLNLLATTVFLQPPLTLSANQPIYGTTGSFFISGSRERLRAAMTADPELLTYAQEHKAAVPDVPAAPTTDDWPYFYQREPGLPTAVLLMSLVLLGLGGQLLRNTGVSTASLNWHFFFLGAGFFLLEAQIISKMALLFGTTWLVNSIVISGLLLLIIGANLLVEWRKDFNIRVAYAGLFGCLLLSYSIRLESLFFTSFWLKALAATAVLCMPAFFAGIVFIRSFAKAGFQGSALGSNLFGALLGGLLESLSMWTGIRSLLVVAALLSLASWVALRKTQTAGLDVETGIPGSIESEAVPVEAR